MKGLAGWLRAAAFAALANVFISVDGAASRTSSEGSASAGAAKSGSAG
ncbi:MAG: hypothetical protein WDN06_08425 [Asticcacaulis sp.]